MVPLSAGPHGVIHNTEEVNGGIDSYSDLYDPQFAGRTAIEGRLRAATDRRDRAGDRHRGPDEHGRSGAPRVGDYMDEHRDQFRALWRSDSDLVNLFKSGEVVISDGNSGQAKRLEEAGVPVEWVAPREGTLSWVCGFGITSKAENLDAAYRLINWQASPEAQAIRAATVTSSPIRPRSRWSPRPTAPPPIRRASPTRSPRPTHRSMTSGSGPSRPSRQQVELSWKQNKCVPRESDEPDQEIGPDGPVTHDRSAGTGRLWLGQLGHERSDCPQPGRGGQAGDGHPAPVRL